MLGKRELWEKMIKKYNLKPHSLDRLVQWRFGDFIFNVESDAFQDVSKARRFEFQEMQIDSNEDVLAALQKLKDDKIIP